MNAPSNAQLILKALDDRLNAAVELTLYGRAALLLGFPTPKAEFALSRDVDAVFWVGQAQELAERTNFWEAVEAINTELADQELYLSHFFEETQVILRPQWRRERVVIGGRWRCLRLFRLGDLDLWLSKLMRDDPSDQDDALFIARAGALTEAQMRAAISEARVPDLAELREQFTICRDKFFRRWRAEHD